MQNALDVMKKIGLNGYLIKDLVCRFRGHRFGPMYKTSETKYGYRQYPHCDRCNKVFKGICINVIFSDEQSES